GGDPARPRSRPAFVGGEIVHRPRRCAHPTADHRRGGQDRGHHHGDAHLVPGRRGRPPGHGGTHSGGGGGVCAPTDEPESTASPEETATDDQISDDSLARTGTWLSGLLIIAGALVVSGLIILVLGRKKNS